MKQYNGLGLVTPWIFEPSQSNSVGQKANIMSGVPEPAKNKNVADKTARIEARRATLFLNQRLSSKIRRIPNNTPMMILGSLTEYALRPKIVMEAFCKSR